MIFKSGRGETETAFASGKRNLEWRLVSKYMTCVRWDHSHSLFTTDREWVEDPFFFVSNITDFLLSSALPRSLRPHFESFVFPFCNATQLYRDPATYCHQHKDRREGGMIYWWPHGCRQIALVVWMRVSWSIDRKWDKRNQIGDQYFFYIPIKDHSIPLNPLIETLDLTWNDKQ